MTWFLFYVSLPIQFILFFFDPSSTITQFPQLAGFHHPQPPTVASHVQPCSCWFSYSGYPLLCSVHIYTNVYLAMSAYRLIAQSTLRWPCKEKEGRERFRRQANRGTGNWWLLVASLMFVTSHWHWRIAGSRPLTNHYFISPVTLTVLFALRGMHCPPSYLASFMPHNVDLGSRKRATQENVTKPCRFFLFSAAGKQVNKGELK